MLKTTLLRAHWYRLNVRKELCNRTTSSRQLEAKYRACRPKKVNKKVSTIQTPVGPARTPLPRYVVDSFWTQQFNKSTTTRGRLSGVWTVPGTGSSTEIRLRWRYAYQVRLANLSRSKPVWTGSSKLARSLRRERATTCSCPAIGVDDGYSSSQYNVPHRYGNSHSVTCHPTEVTFPPLPPAEAGTRLSDPGGMRGRVDLVGRLHTEIVYPPEDGHPSKH